MKVSVAVPVYEYYERGVEFLDDMLRTISMQTLKDVEVVIADHSVNHEIEDYCKLNEYNLDINYIRNEEGRGNPAVNTNKAIDNCTGEIIKVFQQTRSGWCVVLSIPEMMVTHSSIPCYLDGTMR